MYKKMNIKICFVERFIIKVYVLQVISFLCKFLSHFLVRNVFVSLKICGSVNLFRVP